jgi:NADH:ubiquinone oxidoreductase subunit 3 (subunit A)
MYTAAGLFFLGGLLFTGFGLALSRLLQNRRPGLQKGMDYECGEEPAPGVPGRFNLRFLLPALLFLLFEMEVVVLAPLMLSKNQPPEGTAAGDWTGLLRLETLAFSAILLAGLALVLGLGYASWDRKEPQPPEYQGPVPDFAYEQFNIDRERAEARGRTGAT